MSRSGKSLGAGSPSVASEVSEIWGPSFVPGDGDIRSLLVRRFYLNLLQMQPEHPRVVDSGKKHAGEPRDVLRGEKRV